MLGVVGQQCCVRFTLITCDKLTASELCRKSCIIENDRSVWMPLVRSVVAWSRHFGYFVSRHTNCAQKEMFQAPTDLNSCIFSICVILTSKPKWNFCLKSCSLVSWSECVSSLQLSMRRQRNRHCFKWIQSKFREKEKFNLSSLVYGLKNLTSGNFMS